MITDRGSDGDLPIIVKIGSALIADQQRYCEYKFKEVVKLGEEIAGLAPHLQRRLIVVLGGESFMDGIASRHGLDCASTNGGGSEFSRITIGMFRMLSTVVDIWRDVGVSAYPIQPATQVRVCRGELSLMADHFIAAMARQLVPVTTDDVALFPDLSIRSVSADLLAVLLAREIRIACTVFLTIPAAHENSDVPIAGGLSYAAGSCAQDSDRFVGARTSENARTAEAVLALRVLGVPSWIVDGRETGGLARVLSHIA